MILYEESENGKFSKIDLAYFLPEISRVRSNQAYTEEISVKSSPGHFLVQIKTFSSGPTENKQFKSADQHLKLSAPEYIGSRAYDQWPEHAPHKRDKLSPQIPFFSSVAERRSHPSEFPSRATEQSIALVIETISKLERGGAGRQASFFAVFIVEQSFRRRNYDHVNELLHSANPLKLTEWSLIALLRSSFSARRHLPAWDALLESTHSKFSHEGKNVEKLLRGLI
ncbi:hypothetical protein [Stenotrophomonas maltophilia]|uniref:Uncharacterized protein n=2 Tax=Stenotrophomonas maltophilia TaxID=40324 RepID=A0AAI9C5R1_STEMA|nr:hypothetical protein [Stenotrophomonas maltophilia]EKT4094626.1 hypothetical protein [Stenotrophomonas maltophilia]UUS14224.1 hypothetical protein NMB32_20975 [Stenotrophomonas sp. CD2]HEL5043173.1 hypothetical protein [Stenotrophomonas maltophilia]